MYSWCLTCAARGAAVPFAPGEGARPRASLDLHHVALRRQKPAALAAPVPEKLRCGAARQASALFMVYIMLCVNNVFLLVANLTSSLEST